MEYIKAQDKRIRDLETKLEVLSPSFNPESAFAAYNERTTNLKIESDNTKEFIGKIAEILYLLIIEYEKELPKDVGSKRKKYLENLKWCIQALVTGGHGCAGCGTKDYGNEKDCIECRKKASDFIKENWDFLHGRYVRNVQKEDKVDETEAEEKS